MDGFLTSPFISNFPDSLKQSVFSGNSDYYNLFKAIKSGRLVAGTEDQVLADLLVKLKKSEPELYKVFSSLEAAGKLQARKVTEDLPDNLKAIKIRKSVLKKIGQGYSQPAAIVFHDEVGDEQWKKEIIKSGNKPLVDDEDLNTGKVAYLFNEKSIPLNQEEEFNWARFLADYTFPFQRIRILDPYLYTNIHNVDLSSMLRALVRVSDPDKLSIEIISNLSADSKRSEEEVLDKVQKSIDLPDSLSKCFKLYSQTGSASNVFHKRAIWTDFWVLNAERGFDFLKLETSKGTVTRENTLFLTGKYASKNSLWHQVNDNWERYLGKSKRIDKKL